MTDLTSTTLSGPAASMPCIKCPCGFEVSGLDEAHNLAAFEEHDCPTTYTEEPSRWYDAAFSFWGFAIVLIICIAIEETVRR